MVCIGLPPRCQRDGLFSKMPPQIFYLSLYAENNFMVSQYSLRQCDGLWPAGNVATNDVIYNTENNCVAPCFPFQWRDIFFFGNEQNPKNNFLGINKK